MRPLFLLALLGTSACIEHGFSSTKDYSGTGEASLTGRVCDTERFVWLEAATVYTHIITEDGELIGTRETYTDQDGRYTLEELPGGTIYTIYVQYGSELIDMYDVRVETEEQKVLDDPACSEASELSVAVISGDYDNFVDVLGQLGITNYTIVEGRTGSDLVQFLSDTAGLALFDAIFFAGGHIEEDVIYDTDGTATAQVEAVTRAVYDYVNGGGLLYASDWSYDILEACWPNKVDFLGEDGVPDAAQVGEIDAVAASITDGDMESEIGQDTVQVNFDLDTWPVIEDIGDGVTVYQRGDVPWRQGMDVFTLSDAPLLLDFEAGDGRVVFSSWRQESNIDGKGKEVISYMIGDL